MFFLTMYATATAAADTTVVNQHRFELSGLLSFDSYAENIHTVNSLEFGVNWLRFMNSAMDLDVEYRNHSVKGTGALSASSRFFLGRHEIRPGICIGVRSLLVGAYSDNAPIVGLKGIYAFNVSRNLSLRLEVKAQWFFEDHTVFGSKVLLGMCWSFF